MSIATPATHDVHSDPSGSRLGMWLFLFSEMLLFGGLFILYAVYRARYPDAFAASGRELNVVMGAVNTLVLLTSSLTAASSITALRQERPKLSAGYLGATILLALVFLVIKYFEWGIKFEHGLYPGGAGLKNLPPGEALFFSLYYVMTGLHGLHVIVGMLLLLFVLVLVWKGRLTKGSDAWLENAALYWHLVDIIWIYLFPLLYLIT